METEQVSSAIYSLAADDGVIKIINRRNQYDISTMFS
jgi:hypothetical protein